MPYFRNTTLILSDLACINIYYVRAAVVNTIWILQAV